MLPGDQGGAGEQGLGDGSEQRPLRDLAAVELVSPEGRRNAAQSVFHCPLKVRLKVKGRTQVEPVVRLMLTLTLTLTLSLYSAALCDLPGLN